MTNLMHKIQNRTFAEHIKNDKNKHKTYLKRKDALLLKSSKEANEEVRAIDTYERVHKLISNTDLTIQSKSDQNSYTSTKENNLPAETYLSHGGRVTVELPVGSDHSLFNWIASGNSKLDACSNNRNGSLYNRAAATHGISITKDDDKFVIQETKGLLIGVKSAISSGVYSLFSKIPGVSYLTNADSNKVSKHWGMDLNLNRSSKDFSPINGENGHLYVHYKPATADKPGGMLIGVEAYSPNSSNHSKIGASDPYSAVEGLLWDDLVKCKDLPHDVKVPIKYNGMSGKLTQEKISAITGKGYDVTKSTEEEDYDIVNELDSQEHTLDQTSSGLMGMNIEEDYC